MLFKITRYNNNNSLVERLVYLESTPQTTAGSLVINQFKYKYKHPIYPPHLFVKENGDKYIIPTWIKVHPKTTLQDIDWEKEKIETKTQIWEFKSSSGNETYKVHRLPDGKLRCSCMGFWRAKGNCKHVLEVKKL